MIAYASMYGNTEAAAQALAAKLCDKGMTNVVAVSYTHLDVYKRQAGENGREHSSRVLCQEGWKELYNKVNHFYKEYFQDDCGAFYRVISKDSRKPAGVTYEGVKFGDPAAHYSCRTGAVSYTHLTEGCSAQQ